MTRGPATGSGAPSRPLAIDAAADRRAASAAVRSEIARALDGLTPPSTGARAVRIERLRLRLPAGATAADVGHAVAAAIVRAMRGRG